MCGNSKTAHINVRMTEGGACRHHGALLLF